MPSSNFNLIFSSYFPSKSRTTALLLSFYWFMRYKILNSTFSRAASMILRIWKTQSCRANTKELLIYGMVSAVVACSVVVGVIIAVVVTFVSISAWLLQSGISPTHRPIIRRLVVPFVGLQNETENVTFFEKTYSLTKKFQIKIMVTNKKYQLKHPCG